MDDRQQIAKIAIDAVPVVNIFVVVVNYASIVCGADGRWIWPISGTAVSNK